MKKRLFVLLLILLLFLPLVFSHEGNEDFDPDPSSLYPLSQLAVAGYGAISFGILVLIMLSFQKAMNNAVKRAVYILLVMVVSLVTIYLIVTTLHLNIISETKGPVHWHADYEIWACDKEIKLAEPKGLSNKQGVDLMHAHNDNRIHVEGVLLDRKEASLGAFFHAVNGDISSDGFSIPADDGLVVYRDGFACNEQPGKLYVFVNGNLTGSPSNYIISPYEKVPPGDRIKIVFTEKPVEDINPLIGQNGS